MSGPQCNACAGALLRNNAHVLVCCLCQRQADVLHLRIVMAHALGDISYAFAKTPCIVLLVL